MDDVRALAARPGTAPLPAEPGPAGRRGRRVALGLLAAFLLVWTAAPVVRPTHTTSDVRTSMAADVRDVVVDLDSGAVTLRGGSGPGIALRTVRTWIWREPTSERFVVDGVLTVVSRCPEFGIGCLISEELTIPHGTTVQVTTGTGSITATGLDVSVVDLETRAGDIVAVDTLAARLDARSDVGDVHVTFRRPPSVVRIRAGVGSVDLVVPRGRYRMDTGAPAGVRLVGVVEDPGAARLVMAHSSAGSVTIRSR